MNGKLAKRTRKAVNFNPNAARGYRRENVSRWFFSYAYTAVATGNKAAYQNLKASVLAAKRNGDGWEGRHA